MSPPSSSLPPLLVRPHYVPKPWGGRRLETVLGRRDLPQGPIGESYEVADLEDVVSIVESGPFAGRSLREVWGQPFPLLLKVLDAREDLSVQVHPDGRDGVPAKEEVWVALASDGAVAVGSLFGGEPPPPGGWLARLERHPLHAARRATPPSLIAVPPGTVHALLAGALVWEVQTPVDVTWRLDDHGRVGLDGRPRALHLDEAAEVLRRGPEFEACLGEDGLRLEGRRIGVAAHRPGTWDPAGDVAAFLPRGGEVRWRGPGRREEALAVPAGRTVVLPDATKRVESDGWAFSACVRR